MREEGGGRRGREAQRCRRRRPSSSSPPLQRPDRVKVKAQRLDGSKFTTTLTGWPARIFQHEFDHLQGVLLCDRMEAEPAAAAADKLVGLERAFATERPGVAFEAGPRPV